MENYDSYGNEIDDESFDQKAVSGTTFYFAEQSDFERKLGEDIAERREREMWERNHGRR